MTEKRKSPRRRVLKRGKVILHDNRTVLDCTIRDLSEGGARLILEHSSVLPSQFRLGNASDGQVWEVRMVWREADQVGVAFLTLPQKATYIKS